MRPHAKHTTSDCRHIRRVAVFIVVVVVGGGVLLGSSASRVDAAGTRKPTVATAPFTAPAGLPLQDSPPPWGLPADARPYIAAAHLRALSREQLQVHYHAHLDIIANDSKVTVPPGIGFVISGRTATGLAPLHTHDASGVIHIESTKNKPYTLGQVFTEWGVALNPDALGGLKVDSAHSLQAYANGHHFRGDPATIRLRPHLEIALWYGPVRTRPRVPKSYRFPAGD